MYNTDMVFMSRESIWESVYLAVHLRRPHLANPVFQLATKAGSFSKWTGLVESIRAWLLSVSHVIISHGNWWLLVIPATLWTALKGIFRHNNTDLPGNVMQRFQQILIFNKWVQHVLLASRKNVPFIVSCHKETFVLCLQGFEIREISV